MHIIMYCSTALSKSTFHPAGTATDSNTTVIFGTLGGLLGLLLLIVVAAVILWTRIKLCIRRRRQKFKAAGKSYDSVRVTWPCVFIRNCIQMVLSVYAHNVNNCFLILLQTMMLSKWSVCRRTQLMQMCTPQGKTTTTVQTCQV